MPARSGTGADGRNTSRTAATAVAARNDGPLESPNTQRAHAPATMANGKRSTAHDAQRGQNAPDSTPRRMTADSADVPRCSSARRASSAGALGRDTSSACSAVARSTMRQMAVTVSRSASSGSSVYGMIT
jgi:hypothetical protein